MKYDKEIFYQELTVTDFIKRAGKIDLSSRASRFYSIFLALLYQRNILRTYRGQIFRLPHFQFNKTVHLMGDNFKPIAFFSYTEIP